MEENERERAGAPDADQRAEHAQRQLSDDQLVIAERADEQVAQIARVQLFDERQRDAELTAE